jgi:hypothetical protein
MMPGVVCFSTNNCSLPLLETFLIAWNMLIGTTSRAHFSLYFPLQKGLSHEIFTIIFWLEWIHLGLNGNRFWFLNFKEGSSVLDSYWKYWWVPYQTFSEICRISEKDWQLSSRFSNLSFFWVSGPLRNAAKGVNTSRRFYEYPGMIDN